MIVRTRFAPSPTGYLHIGGLRTALFSWLYARRHSGRFVLRIEDTDLERSTDAAIQQILDGLEWAGLTYDEGPIRQTQRFDRYKEVIELLIVRGRAYHCYCTKQELEEMRARQIERGEKPRYDGRCRERTDVRPGVAPVVRFKNPLSGSVVVDDVVHGRVEFNNSELDDLIIARSDGSPTYNFCVVVDDGDMQITHVIRGDDHLNNTPRQINMLRALELEPPVYAHLPMILGSDGAKLSKRQGALSVLDYRNEGYLPEALLNYLVRLGWSHGDQEIFSLDEMISLFNLADVNKSASGFDADKLRWVNQQHLMRSTPARLTEPLRRQLTNLGIMTDDDAKLMKVAAVQRERVATLKEMAENSAFFFRPPVAYDEKALRKHVTAETLAALANVLRRFEGVAEWSAPNLHAVLVDQSNASGLALGKVAQPLRLAVSGGAVSPPIDATLEILGREESVARISRAVSAWRA